MSADPGAKLRKQPRKKIANSKLNGIYCLNSLLIKENILLTKPAKASPAPAKRAPAKASAKPAASKPAQAAAVKKPPGKPAATPRPSLAAAAVPPKSAKPAKAKKKIRLIRDGFIMPEAEHALIASLKKRCLALGVEARKSEILRAALAVLADLNDKAVVVELRRLQVIKTGRPAKDKK